MEEDVTGEQVLVRHIQDLWKRIGKKLLFRKYENDLEGTILPPSTQLILNDMEMCVSTASEDWKLATELLILLRKSRDFGVIRHDEWIHDDCKVICDIFLETTQRSYEKTEIKTTNTWQRWMRPFKQPRQQYVPTHNWSKNNNDDVREGNTNGKKWVVYKHDSHSNKRDSSSGVPNEEIPSKSRQPRKERTRGNRGTDTIDEDYLVSTNMGTPLSSTFQKICRTHWKNWVAFSCAYQQLPLIATTFLLCCLAISLYDLYVGINSV